MHYYEEIKHTTQNPIYAVLLVLKENITSGIILNVFGAGPDPLMYPPSLHEYCIYLSIHLFIVTHIARL